MKELLSKEIFGNSVQEYLIVIAAFLVSIVIIKLLKKFVEKSIKSKKEEAENENQKIIYSLSINVINKIVIPFLYFGVLFLSMKLLYFGPNADKVIQIIYMVIIAWFLTRIAITATNYFITKFFEKSRSEDEQHRIRPLLSFFNLILWLIGLLFLLDNLGFEISSIVAGLGIGGIAVALGAQAILGDLFSYFVIFFDKPFQIGDFIIFDDKLGVIEDIGIKTTKIRSLSGEQIIVSNSNLTGSRVHNYKRMKRRRVLFSLGVTYQTKLEHLKEIPKMIKEIIESIDQTEFDRSHFKNYGDFSLNFETVYYINTNDYNTFMDIQQEINLKINEEFNKRNIEFAYPTQTLYLNKERSDDRNIEYA